jgi:hypothetical protein
LSWCIKGGKIVFCRQEQFTGDFFADIIVVSQVKTPELESIPALGDTAVLITAAPVQ